MSTKILTIFFLLSVFILLIGTRFNFTWSGGSGYEKPMPATAEIYSNSTKNKIEVKRGQLIKTGSNETAIIYIGERIVVSVDERTDIVVEKLSSSGVEITLRGGRLWAKTSSETEKLTISSPETSDFITSGSVTAVRYDSLNETDIIPFSKFDWLNSTDRGFFLWAADLMGIVLSQ